jgi:biopolymer transport protein TolR
MRRRRFSRLGGEGGLPVQAEINITNLVDVAFTLLVIFMITAPILQGGVQVDVPKAPAAPIQTTEGVVITIDANGQIYLDDTKVSMQEFDASVVQVIKRRQSPVVYVKGDASVPYGVVLRVIGKLKEADIQAVSLIAQPESERQGG